MCDLFESDHYKYSVTFEMRYKNAYVQALHARATRRRFDGGSRVALPFALSGDWSPPIKAPVEVIAVHLELF